jgi:hypothetical protein
MLDFLAAIAEFFAAIWSADKSIKENSIIGESRFDREARGSWVTCGLICLILLLIAAAGGIAWMWWG